MISVSKAVNIPTQKTRQRDSVWIADLVAHGWLRPKTVLIKPNFVPPPVIRQLRDLPELRVQVTGEHTRVRNCMHKVLEDANIKLDTVLSDLLGVSGRAMLRGLIQGRTDPGWLGVRKFARQAGPVSAGAARAGHRAPSLLTQRVSRRVRVSGGADESATAHV